MKQLFLLFILISFFTIFMERSKLLAQGASGLHNPIFSAISLAQGNAFTARANDPSAIQFNPAGLTQLDRPEISLGSGFVYPTVEYHDNGLDEDMDTGVNILPNIYFVTPIIKNKLSAGLGVNVPYGLNGEWDDNGFSRFVITDFSLQILNVNPTLTYQPCSFLSIGVGLNYYYADTDQERRINVGLINSSLTGLPVDPSTPEGDQDLEMHGDGFGYNAGILLHITPRHNIGLTFRSKADLDLEGRMKLSNLSGATAFVFGGSDKFDTRTDSGATIPEMISFGYAYNHEGRWSIEFDAQWTNWSRFDVVRQDFKETNFLLEANREDIRDWDNTWSFALGGEYVLNEAIKLRGGYTFHETPVPSDTFEPSMPQGSRHGLFTGFGYSWGKDLNKNIDLAYGVVFYENRKVNNSVGDAMGGPIDGRYDLLTHILAINFNYRF